MQTQQSFLRKSMRKLGLTREEFSARFNISRRRLDSWLLPDTSPGFRTMNLELQNQVYEALRIRDDSDEIPQLEEATIDESVPTIHCDKFGFDFPTLYRITIEIADTDIKTGELNGETTIDYEYALSPSPRMLCSNVRQIAATPIGCMDGPMDAGWVYINEHRSYDRAEAFAMCIFTTQPESVCMTFRSYVMNGRIFTIFHTRKPNQSAYINYDSIKYKKKNRIVIYNSDQYLKRTEAMFKHLFRSVEQDAWGIEIGPDGKLEN